MGFSRITDFVWIVNKALLILALILSAFIIIYDSVRKALDNRSQNRLENTKKLLRNLARSSKTPSKDTCSGIINRLTIKQIFDIVKSDEAAGSKEFKSHLTSCLEKAGKFDRLEKIASGSGRKWTRIQAIMTLGYCEIHSALPILKDALLSKDSDISYFSMLALGQIKNNMSARILLDFLEKKMYSGYKIVSILESFPRTIVKEVVNKTGSSDPVARFWAVKLLTTFKPQDHADRIEELTRDESADVRAASCEFLGELKNKRSLPPILQCLNDSAWFVRMRAVRALFSLLEKDCVSYIIGMLNDPSKFVKESVKEVVIQDIESYLPHIETCLLTGSEEAKKCCVDALVDSEYISQLLKSLLSEHPDKKERATALLAALIRSDFYFGLKKVLDTFPGNDRKSILEIIKSMDSGLEKRIR
ncbi:MAG: HEAT repeat domain-containing protein [Candidatus Omnitrophota bacterium]